MCNFFRSFYNDDLIHKAHTKFIPQFMMNSSNEIISKFLKGYWRGDGHWKMRTDRKNNQYFCTASSTSKELIYQLQQLLLKLRIFSTIYYKKKSPTCVIENRIVNQRSQWEVKIVGLDAIKFIIEILNENIDEFHPSYKPRINHTFNGDFLEIKVKNIHHIDTEEMVYDLSVENDHSYTANGIAVHNCIYPKYAEVPVKEESLLTGELEPTNQAYAIAKIAGIKMCQAYRKQYGCDFISVMPCNLYGENDNFHPTYSHVIPALIRRFVEATEKDAPTVTVWGTGNARREFLYVDDMADACIFLMEKYSDERIINIGYGTDYTIKDIVGNIAEIIGYKGEIIWDTTKPDGTPKRILDTSRLFDMDWRPQIPLKEGLTKTINWYKLHKDETK
jgi:dTDP-D-glucose 4,6-dehydratase